MERKDIIKFIGNKIVNVGNKMVQISPWFGVYEAEIPEKLRRERKK